MTQTNVYRLSYKTPGSKDTSVALVEAICEGNAAAELIKSRPVKEITKIKKVANGKKD
jgi:hypothetical protein